MTKLRLIADRVLYAGYIHKGWCLWWMTREGLHKGTRNISFIFRMRRLLFISWRHHPAPHLSWRTASLFARFPLQRQSPKSHPGETPQFIVLLYQSVTVLFNGRVFSLEIHLRVCGFPIRSLACPPPVLDLRTIMDMEANSLQSLTPRSPGRYETTLRCEKDSCLLLPRCLETCFCVIASMKHYSGPTKLSQKQRKSLAMANKEASVESNTSKPTPPVTSSKSSGKAWWVTKMSSLLISLRLH